MSIRVLMATAVLLFALPGVAAASASKVSVNVSVIHASNDGDSVDPRLEDLRRQLSAFDFSSFKLLDRTEKTVSLQQTAGFDLPGGRRLDITPQRRDSEGRLTLRLSISGLIDTTYTIAEGSSIIVGGPRHGPGHLILAVNQKTAR